MAKARRSRTVSAAPEQVFKLITDPHHMPRWWPEVRRMEGVEEEHFTQVFLTKKGRPVRADFHVLEREPPDSSERRAGRCRWEQELIGTPFERLLNESITEILLEPVDSGTRITIEQRQRLRGYSRTGGFLLRRASGAKLEEALEALERIL